MVVIRLSRVGKKNHATFRVIVSDRQKDTHGTYLELLGHYDPHRQPAQLELNAERVKYWISVGAKPSDTVFNLLVEKGLIEGPKRVIVKAKPVESKAEPVATAAAPAPELKTEPTPAAKAEPASVATEPAKV
jgi:small subunit ribosomal protein S16